MLKYNEIKEKTYIVLDGQPYEVLSSNVFRKQANKPVNQTKLKSLSNGKVIEKSFHQSDKVEEAVITTQDIIYLYYNRGEFWFCEKGNPKARFNISEGVVGDNMKFIKQKEQVEAVIFGKNIIDIKVPIKVELAVIDAPPNVKGNTAQGGTKDVTLETGAVVNVPLFITTGDTIRVNTETGQYAERAKKSN